jgi:amidohydrolase
MTQNNTLLQSANELFPYTQDLRRDFHRHPELGFQEFRTAQKVAGQLRALGLEVSTGIGQTGVVALIEGDQPGPVILLRFDMDALPIVEETALNTLQPNPASCTPAGMTAIPQLAYRCPAAERPPRRNLRKDKIIVPASRRGSGRSRGGY